MQKRGFSPFCPNDNDGCRVVRSQNELNQQLVLQLQQRHQPRQKLLCTHQCLQGSWFLENN